MEDMVNQVRAISQDIGWYIVKFVLWKTVLYGESHPVKLSGPEWNKDKEKMNLIDKEWTAYTVVQTV